LLLAVVYGVPSLCALRIRNEAYRYLTPPDPRTPLVKEPVDTV
jgi:hypothetical protein